jgi:hypothetical protein
MQSVSQAFAFANPKHTAIAHRRQTAVALQTAARMGDLNAFWGRSAAPAIFNILEIPFI